MLKSKRSIIAYSILGTVMLIFIILNTFTFKEGQIFYLYEYIMSFVLTAAAWVLGVCRFKFTEKLKFRITISLLLLVSFFDMQLSMIFAGTPEFTFSIYFINILFYFTVTAIVFAVCHSVKISGIVSVSATYLFNLSSFVVKIMRGTPLTPGDFLAIGTAAQVAGNYSFEVTYEFVFATMFLIFAVSLFLNFSWELKFSRKKKIILSSVFLTAAFSFITVMSFIDINKLNLDMYDQIHMNNTHGVAYSFLINLRKMKLTKPVDYDEQYVENELLVTEEAKAISENMPNIIVIMNESFADLGVNGELHTDNDYMRFFYSLNKNTIRGQMLVTPFGGGTCNTEYEFLTGMSMATLPSGSMPYLQYIRREYPLSLVRHLSSMGYKTAALHPFAGHDWNRDKVYGFFGFDNFVSAENMTEYLPESEFKYVRNYLSDETDYNILLSMLRSKNPDERMFIFNVTIQNHGGYYYNDINEQYDKVHITNLGSHYSDAEQYISLIGESDKVFERFIGEIKDMDEPTVVVFFGDHQPGLEDAFFSELYNKPMEEVTIEDIQTRYIVPFVIWANYDIESRSEIFTSPPYLSNYVLDAAGLPYSSVNSFLEKEKENIPALNDMGHYEKDGSWHINDSDANEWLRNYAYVQYYMLKKH